MKEGKKTLKPWSGGKGGAQQNQFFMEVRTEHVKILIGKRGEKVHSMMQESGAKIFISNQPGQDSSMRKMAIMGPADAVAKAKALVNAQIEYAETSAVLEQSTTVQIPVKQTGLVIGKAGATIKDIEAETGATVNIESRNQPQDGAHTSVRVSGSAEAIEQAVARINAIVADASASGGSSRGSNGGEKVVVPTSAIALIIGKAGKNIRDLEAVSGARVTVDQKKTGGDTRVISIWSPSGDQSAVAAAKASLLETVEHAGKFGMRDDQADDSSPSDQRRAGPAQRRSRMFAGRKERGRGGADEHRGAAEVSAAMSGSASSRTTVSAAASDLTLVDVAAEAEELMGKGHAVDNQATALAQEVASILALNPLMEAADKRAFVRRFLKNAARPEEESRRLLDTGM
eukprot:Tamp_06916.p1 GENE.Tamp_06916~~Tamp_06916.p1  ORF type:complete len:443 (+),score=136.26 Tamp_06916:129-1331(+)